MKYTPEYITYIKKYPYAVVEDFLNGIKNEIVCSTKQDATDLIARGELKHKRAKYTLIENRLNPEYM